MVYILEYGYLEPVGWRMLGSGFVCFGLHSAVLGSFRQHFEGCGGIKGRYWGILLRGTTILVQLSAL